MKSNRRETIKYLSQTEVRDLLQVVSSKRDKAIFLVAYRHGLRASEIGLLDRNDFDEQKRRLYVHRLKGSLSGDHLMQPDEVRAVKAYLKTRNDDSPTLFISRLGNPISRIQLHKLMKRYGEEAGLRPDRRHFHVLKHSIATHMLDGGSDIMHVKDWLGHAQISSTMHYAVLRSRKRDEEAARLAKTKFIV